MFQQLVGPHSALIEFFSSPNERFISAHWSVVCSLLSMSSCTSLELGGDPPLLLPRPYPVEHWIRSQGQHYIM